MRAFAKNQNTEGKSFKKEKECMINPIFLEVIGDFAPVEPSISFCGLQMFSACIIFFLRNYFCVFLFFISAVARFFRVQGLGNRGGF